MYASKDSSTSERVAVSSSTVPPPGLNRRSQSRISVMPSSSPNRVLARAARSAISTGPAAVSRVSEGAAAAGSVPAARRWMRSR